jgi:hypothetical protein
METKKKSKVFVQIKMGRSTKISPKMIIIKKVAVSATEKNAIFGLKCKSLKALVSSQR